MRHHERVTELFLACCELEPPAREELLGRECAGDAPLRAEVEAMLDFDRRRPAGEHAPPLAEAPLPERIGPFRVVRLIGEGGMGTVFEVEQERPHRRVALKLLRSSLAVGSVVRRLEREGELLGRLQHPGIARIYESGKVDTPFGAQPYLAMELVHGEPLTRWARERRATTRQRLEVLATLCDAVQHAHEHGVVHRDLKPGNILVDGSGQPRVLDFGIARALDTGPLPTLRTSAGEIVGTLAYMSPEQAGGAPDVDARADVYSLGVLLHELLAGELPHDLGNMPVASALEALRSAEPRRLGDVDRAFRGDLETIALKALEKDPARRYATAAALAADLRRHLAEEPIEARPPTSVYRVRKFVRRNRTAVRGVAAVLLAVTAGLLVALHFARGEAEERERAASRDTAARLGDYQSGLLSAQRLLEEGSYDAARARLDELPADLRCGDWGLLDHRLQRQLDELAVPELWQALFLADGRVLAVDACTDRLVWDPVTRKGRWLGSLAAGAKPLALSRGGLWMLALSESGDELLLAETLGSGVTSFPVPERPPRADGTPVSVVRGWRASAVSDDGGRIVLAFTDGTGWLRETRGEPVWDPLVPTGLVIQSLVFSPDGHRLAVGARDHLRLFDVDARLLMWRNRAEDVLYLAFDFEADGNLFVSAASGMMLLDGQTGRVLQRRTAMDLKTQHLGQTLDLARLGPAPAPDAGTLLGAVALNFFDGSTWLFDGKGRLDGVLMHRGRQQTSIAATPDGRTLLTCGTADDMLRLWSTEALDNEVLGRTKQPIYPLALAPDGLLVATGAWDGMARLWEIPGGREVAALGCAAKRVEALAFSPDGRTLACGLGVGGLVTWDLASGQPRVRRNDVQCGAVAYSPDGSRLAAGHGDAVLLLDPATLEERLALRPVGNYTTSVAWSPDGRLLACGSRNAVLSLREASTGAELSRMDGNRSGAWEWTGVRALAFSPDGRRLGSAWGGSQVFVHDVPDCNTKRLLTGHRNEVFALAWSPDGLRLATGGRDNLLRLWNPDTGGLMLSLPGHEDYIYSLGFTPDGRRLLSGSGDHTLRLWDTAPAALRWKERNRAQVARTELAPVVDELLRELVDPDAVARRLEARADLDLEEQRVALDLLLERSREAAAR